MEQIDLSDVGEASSCVAPTVACFMIRGIVVVRAAYDLSLVIEV